MTVIEIAQELDQHLQAVRQILKQPLENEFAPGELTGPQRKVMQVLVQLPGLSLKELSKQVGLAHSTVSGIIDRLERRGLVQRVSGEPDRRVTRLVVTEQVLQFVQLHGRRLGDSPLLAALQQVSSVEQALLLEGVRKLRSLLEMTTSSNQRA